MSTESRLPYPQVVSGPTPLATRPPDASTPVEVHLRAGSVAALRSLRAGLGECLTTGGCTSDLVTDAQLVLAEIATNAFVHDAAPLVDVQVTCGADEIVISTWHLGSVAPPSHPVRPSPPSGPIVAAGGRGLMMVDQIVTSREVSNRDGCTTTVVHLAR